MGDGGVLGLLRPIRQFCGIPPRVFQFSLGLLNVPRLRLEPIGQGLELILAPVVLLFEVVVPFGTIFEELALLLDGLLHLFSLLCSASEHSLSCLVFPGYVVTPRRPVLVALQQVGYLPAGVFQLTPCPGVYTPFGWFRGNPGG